MNLYNILITPLVLVRAPLMIIAFGLLWAGEHLENAARAVPGWRK